MTVENNTKPFLDALIGADRSFWPILKARWGYDCHKKLKSSLTNSFGRRSSVIINLSAPRPRPQDRDPDRYPAIGLCAPATARVRHRQAGTGHPGGPHPRLPSGRGGASPPAARPSARPDPGGHATGAARTANRRTLAWQPEFSESSAGRGTHQRPDVPDWKSAPCVSRDVSAPQRATGSGPSRNRPHRR